MKKTARRLSSLFLVATITASLVVAALAPLFSAPTEAQTNPQTTDIFTGQFIPAYYGAAYDPTEAFKQMAGLPVYVFAYDTWGKIVNNFAYKTQIKADGSFQAAGLPNASHYGVCFAVKDNDTLQYFRAPKPEDGIQSAFAYSQAILPEEMGTINTQIADKPADMTKMSDPSDTPTNLDDDQGCRVFLTSSRQVDIANHVNIFPLVPTSILSVIIKDGYSGAYDFYNLNKPYEVYAQRVVINNSTQAAVDDAYGTGDTGCDITEAACRTEINSKLSDGNAVAVGPVIRGRTIAYNPVDEEGASQGSGTIFQAFAPRGVYVITYWRPDSRSANAKMTYLTFDGQSSLDTPYNGIAIETVDVARPKLWKTLSTRSATEDSDEVWVAKYGTVNAWGMATRGRNGQIVPQAGITLEINDVGAGFMDIFTRACAPGNVQQYQTSADGLYIVSSACASNANNAASSAPVQAGNINTTIRALGTSGSGSGLGSGGSAAGGGLNNLVFSEQSGLSMLINGREGPSRRDIPLNNIPDAYRGMLERDGKPFAFARIDLLVNGHRYANVAKSDSTGFFYIPTTYFNDNPYTRYEVQVQPDYNAPGFLANYTHKFTLDNSQVLAAVNNRGADMGVIAINKKQPSRMESFLAGLSLENLFKVLRFPTAYAQQKIKPKDDDPNPGKKDMSLNEPWKFEIDLESLGAHAKYFNPANYHLKTVEINPPSEGLEGATWMDSEYEYFTRNNEGEDVFEGEWLVGASTDEKSSLLIKGVQLKYENDGYFSFAQRFKDLDTTYLSFNLRVRFEYKGGSAPQRVTDVGDTPVELEEDVVDSQQNSVGQTQGFARVLEATWPVEVRAITASGNIQDEDIQNYEVLYSPIVLDVEAPNCGGGSLLKDGFIDVVKGTLCKIVIGGINGIKKVINFLADNFLTVDPLNFPGSSVVIKYWNIVRNFVNSLAVLILLVAGVAIMLQYEPTTYNLQSVLKKLIISIVLINFSILLIQIAVDVANVLSQGGYYMLNDMFETNSGGLANVNSAIGALAGAMVMMLATAVATGFTGFLGVFVFLFAIILLLLYVSWKIIIQYFFRMATLWICIVLAPAAFAARVLPGTTSYFGKWKNILVGALVGQAALALMLGLALAMISEIQRSGGLVESFVLLVVAFAMLYMSTKLPARAAAMVGTDLSAGLSGAVKGGLLKGGGYGKKFLGDRALRKERRRAEAAAREADGMGKFNTFRSRLRGGVRKGITGVGSEDLDKERQAVIGEAQRYRRRQLEAERPGLVTAEMVGNLEDEEEKVELRGIAARGGFSQSKFENYRNMIDTGRNVDYGLGKVEIGGDDWKRQFYKSDFFKNHGGIDSETGEAREGSVAAKLLTAMQAEHDASGNVNTEALILNALKSTGDGGRYDGDFVKDLAKDDVTFSQLQGPHGARGYMLAAIADTATKVDPTLNTDYNAIRNQLGRNTYDPTTFVKASPLPAVTAPAPPAFSANAATWANRNGFIPLTTAPAGVPAGTDLAQLQNDLARLNTLANSAGSGTVLTDAERAEYTRIYKKLASLGYRPS